MKKNLIIITMLFAFSLSLLSQTQEPSALYFSIPQSTGIYTKQFSISDLEYKQNKFVISWQWNNHPRMTNALKMSASHGHEPSWGPNSLTENTGPKLDYIWQPASWVEPNQYAVPHFLAYSFTYKPTINPNVFNPGGSDSEHNIWGFRNRGITTPVITNNKLELTPTTSYTNPVLSNPWRCNNFYKISDKDTVDEIDIRSYNGKYWRVSVNLRRKDFSPPNNTKDNAPVLVIKMPYYMTAGSSIPYDTIRFDTKPNPLVRTQMNYSYSDGTNNHTISRGYQLGLDTALSDSIVITRNMLPNLTDSIAGIGPDITVTFSFIADGLFGSNPVFKTGPNDKIINRIDSIGLNVYYRGNCGILLNYIRVGNPMSDKLWKGEFDSLYQNRIQTGINIIKEKNYKLFRFYGRDEIADTYELWDAMRYFNKLVGGLAVTEGNSSDPRYLYRTETPNS